MSEPVATEVESLLENPEIAPVPVTVLDEVLQISGLPPESESFELARDGLAVLIRELVRSGSDNAPVDRSFVDYMISELTEKMARQIDEILHHPLFQSLEAAWRSLKFVIDRVEFRENVCVELLNVSKEDLLIDFEDSPEIVKSGMYRIVYSTEFGQFGGKPYALLVGNYTFAPSPQDIALLSHCAAVATMAHAPFIAAAGPEFFGRESFHELPQLKDLASMFEGPQYTKWQSFRDSDDSRYVGLTLPQFLLRLPYGAATLPVKAFNYEEDVVGEHGRFLWGNAAFAFATRVADSFARYRWCPNIIGPDAGGTVEDLPLHQYEALGRIQSRMPTEIMVTERREWELSEEGFIALTYRRDAENACFFSANSTQKPKTFGRSEEALAAELNYRLGTQLPYLFICSRLAHYLKVLQREQIGTWKERQDLERELNKWIGQFVANQEVVAPSVRARRPLREAKVTVSEVSGNAGWYKIDLSVRPHFKYMGAVFQLGLVGRLDRE